MAPGQVVKSERRGTGNVTVAARRFITADSVLPDRPAPRKSKLPVYSVVHPSVTLDKRDQFAKSDTPAARRRAALSASILHDSNSRSHSDKEDVRKKDRPTCKERPKRNAPKVGGGRGGPRRFVPWCG